MARGNRDRLSDLPDPILLDILSLLPEGKAVVRTSVLSQRWRFLWKSVTVSLDFEFPDVPAERRLLIAWLRLIESFIIGGVTDIYEFPQFAFKNTSFKNLVLSMLKVNPSGSVNWSSLVSLSIGDLNLTEDVMEKILSGCPNLECLKLDSVKGIRRLEISSVKLRELIIEDHYFHNHDFCFEILGPYIQNLQILSFYSKICLQQRNVASLVTAVLGLEFGQRNLKEECSYLKELLHSVAHVDNLELSPWCIECLSILELEGWQPPLSSRKFLKLNTALEQLDLPGFCSFLQSSLDLETLVIDWSNYGSRHQYVLPWYKNKDEQCKRFEKIHNFNCSLLHLKTIKFINMAGPLSENKFVLPLIKYLLENATVLERFIIAVGCKGYVSQDCVKMEQELLSFLRSSPHASVVFSYGPSLY